MREAVIVSTARTPLAKSHRGEFNQTPGAQLGAFSVQAAVQRAGIDPGLIEDLIWGCGYPEGTTGRNIGRQTALRAGLPVTVGARSSIASAPRACRPLPWPPGASCSKACPPWWRAAWKAFR